jgi:glucose/arabinose dehydrogenase
MHSVITFIAAIVLVAVCISFSQCGVSKSSFNRDAAEKNYAALCADCHGKEITDFKKITWRYGITQKEIAHSITNGYDVYGMPSYGKTLTANQINDLALLMINGLEEKNKVILDEPKGDGTFHSESITVKFDTIAKDLDVPWGFAQVDKTTFLITDRNGTLYKVNDKQQKVKIKNVPTVLSQGQGGLLDIELHPDFASNGWLYLSYSKQKEVNKELLQTTAIVRAKLIGDELNDVQELFEALPYRSTKHHYGSRIVFDKNNKLYFSIGDRGAHLDNLPQELSNDLGKIHRMNDDGSIPTDNPFYQDATAHKSIYSFGHRNPQGMVYDAQRQIIWENEHGPKGGDEINILHPGINYGWPVISYGINYDGSILTPIREKSGMQQPDHYWVPSIACAGMCVVTGNRYPQWLGDVLVTSLKFNYLNRCIVKDGKIVGEEKLLKNSGRMRNVQMGSDGYIYVCLEDPGIVVRLLPIN